MKRCLAADYLETFLTVRELLALNDDGEALLGLRRDVEHLHPDSRKAGLLGFEDAIDGRPLRSRKHLCRMHVGAQCTACQQDLSHQPGSVGQL